ncbi:hypothetical protein C3488_38040 [Streptomyces sp. Ru72]|nr:hypothetical protein C3488_38040 [Streptomyces sp. Ru72]
MALYDRRAHSALRTLGIILSHAPGPYSRYSRYIEAIEDLAQGLDEVQAVGDRRGRADDVGQVGAVQEVLQRTSEGEPAPAPELWRVEGSADAVDDGAVLEVRRLVGPAGSRCPRQAPCAGGARRRQAFG